MTTEKSIPKEPRHAAVSEKFGSRSGGAAFSGPLEGLLRAAVTLAGKQLCSEGSTGGKRVYTLNRRRSKKLIPVKGTVSLRRVPLARYFVGERGKGEGC